MLTMYNFTMMNENNHKEYNIDQILLKLVEESIYQYNTLDKKSNDDAHNKE